MAFYDPLIAAYKSLSSGENTVDETVGDDAVISELLPELTLSMSDEELITLKREWVKIWEPYKTQILKMQKQNEDYWLGAQFGTENSPKDNLIFEALETFLPIATRPKADPLVESDNTEAGNLLAARVRKMLVFISDNLSYNLKLKQVARYWALYMLGVMKVGWSMKENDITCLAVRPQKLILEPKACIEESEYTGYYIGETLEDMASDLVLRFPKKKKFIEDKVKNKMGTKLEYVLWTTDEYIFWTLEDEVLAKSKNPHWNYETTQPVLPPVDQFGNVAADPATGLPMQPTEQTVPGKNHFRAPKKPYIFLSVFSLGKQPHDDTNLVQQNISLQDLVNKRLQQIDKNADNANGGLAVSGDSFTEEQAGKAAKAKRNGGVIWVPTGPVGDAVVNLTGEALPNFVYESLIDYRNEIRNIFGTRGSSAQGTIAEKTVGGKQIIKGQDTDRIGGGISTFLEQFSDKVFNWFVQLMIVYYDEPHSANVLGKERAQEYISLEQNDFIGKLLVGVKDGSMIPTDPASQRDEAITLWQDKGIDPITFFDRLEFPNPRESAKNLFLWMSNPIALFPDLQAQQQAQQAQQMAQQQAAQGQQVQQQAQVEAANTQSQQKHEMAKIALQGLVKQAPAQ